MSCGIYLFRVRPLPALFLVIRENRPQIFYIAEGSRCPSRVIPSCGLNICRRTGKGFPFQKSSLFKRIPIILGTNNLCESVNSFTQINEAACQHHIPDYTATSSMGCLPQDSIPQQVRNFIRQCHSCTGSFNNHCRPERKGTFRIPL